MTLQFAAGQRVTADDMLGIETIGAYRISTQSVGNTTFANDDTLFFAAEASFVYKVHLQLFYTGGTQGSSDMKVTFSVPGPAVWRWNSLGFDASGNLNWSNENLAGDTQVFGTSATATRTAKIEGTLAMASTAGNFRLQFAQNSSNATATVMQPYSSLLAWRIA